MEIRRYTCPGGYKNGKWVDILAYAYIKATWFERRKLDRMILDGKTNLRRHPHRGTVTDAYYILRPKGKAI